MASPAIDVLPTASSFPHLRAASHRMSFDGLNMAPPRAVFFDYDDTLLPSTFLASQGCLRLDAEVTQAIREQLSVISAAVFQVLTLAIDSGSSIFIITNSETGWVQLSCQKFMPEVSVLLSRVTILSARSTYEKAFPGAPVAWKKAAFKDCLDRLFSQCPSCAKNILSLGDSQTEREAILQAGKELSTSTVKNVKFVERPSIEQLKTELDLISKTWSHLCSYESALDLMLSLTRVESA